MSINNSFLKRVWADVNLDNIAYNYRVIRSIVSDEAKIMAIVKADGYGHGAIEVSRLLENLNADYFGVSNLDEAKQIRHAGIRKPIIILGFTPAECCSELLDFDITQTVYNKETAAQFNEIAKKYNKKLKVHIKVDTGMSRIGMFFQNKEKDFSAIEEAKKIYSLENLFVEGIFTHFANADDVNSEYTDNQFELFMYFCEKLEQSGINVGLKHCCNSAGILNYKNMHLDMVRPGIILYGLAPDNDLDSIKQCDLRPAMELKSVISYIKEVREGISISYGGIYATKQKTKIATLPIGYADGFSRILSNSAQVLIKNKKAKIIGRVCMDQCMVDVTDIENVTTNDIATIFGQDGDKFISACSMAEALGTIGYEVVCQIGKRVPRVYSYNGEKTGYLNYIEGIN